MGVNGGYFPVVKASSLCIGKAITEGYQLRRLRGRGGFGSVWEAERKDGKRVALKFLPAKDNLMAAQEVRSIQIVRQLRHPNLIRIEQVCCNPGYVIVTMELADGSLFDLFEAYQLEYGALLPPKDVCQHLGEVARVLDFLNCRQHSIDGQCVAVQHCDIKPTNLLLFGDRVKISDFGLCSVTGSPVRFHRRAGTLDYAAPEIFQGRLSDWTDQYALAVTYCQLRSGLLPFPNTPKTFQKTYVRPAPDLSMLSPSERPIIARALAQAPQDRWPTCVDLMAQLRTALAH
jgi:serine/threonine-protein kinase